MVKRIVSNYVGAQYADLAKVLSLSAIQHCPSWEQDICRMPDEDGSRSPWEMHQDRLVRYRAAIAQSGEGDGLLLIDADTLIVRSLNRIWAREFDVAYTVHRYADCAWPVNTGVLFVRASPRVVAFFDAWIAASRAIGTDESTEAFRAASKQYGAPDQQAFWETLQSQRQSVRAIAVPCREWNCADAEWEHFTPMTRIVHIKGVLRTAIRGRRPSGRRARFVAPLVDLWCGYAALAGLTPEVAA